MIRTAMASSLVLALVLSGAVALATAPVGAVPLPMLYGLRLLAGLSAAAIIPLAPLTAATTYDVSFIGKVNGADVTYNWSFSTR